MTRFTLIATSLAVVLCAGCHKKEVSDHDKMEAINAFSDAQFAMGIKDFPRAEASYQKAVELVADNPDYQFNYGVAEVKLGKKSDAKGPYKKALSLYKEAYKTDNKNLGAARQAIFLDLLLHEEGDAKDFLDQLIKDHPDARDLAAFRSSGGLDKLAQTSTVQDLAL